VNTGGFSIAQGVSEKVQKSKTLGGGGGQNFCSSYMTF